jgi:hypothetical protein
MRKLTVTVLSALALLAAPAAARQPDTADNAGKPDKAEKPVTEKDVTAEDVVATPVTDLNLKKDEIPPLLVAAEQRPYTLRGLASCQQIAGAVHELDAVLGEDIDLPQNGGKRTSPGRVAQSVIGAFIPFRGVIRELSGANAHDRQLQAAILAGVARRSFLKGIGQGRGCRYPARAATLEVFNQRLATAGGGEIRREPPPAPTSAAPARERRGSMDEPRYVSQPVVQRTD